MNLSRIILLTLSLLILLLLMPFFNSILGGFLIAYLFKSLFESVENKVRNRTVSAGLVTFVSVIVLLLINYLFFRTVITSFIQMQALIDKNVLLLNNIISSMSADIIVTSTPSNIIDYFYGLFTSAPKTILDFIIVVSVTFYSLKDFEKVKLFIKSLFDHKISKAFDRIYGRVEQLINSFIYGHLMVSLILSIMVFTIVSFLKIPFSLELSSISFAMGVFPILSAYMLTLIVGFYYLFFADYLRFIILIVVSVILFFIDRNVKVLLHAKDSINHLLLVVGLVGGVAVFGFYGFIAGPILTSLAQALIEELYKF
ncbi:AI-2E family transporter [Candidatus Tiddalikarchaeum anstoanum]|nr:AI-2E family transporter [Candidatus Tiddalikarchaeum anstoanum]